MSRSVLCLLGLFLSQLVVAADEKFAWREPFELQLPEVTRTIVLRAGTDAGAFAARHALDGASILPMGKRGSLLEVAMDDQAWQSFSDQACAESGVSACDTAVCQGIQLAGSAQPGSGFSAEAVQARLVRNAPEQVPLPSEVEGDAGSCKGPPLVPPLDQAAGAGQNLSIDLSVIQSDSAAGTGKRIDGASTDAAEPVADAAGSLPDAAGASEAAAGALPDAAGSLPDAAGASEAAAGALPDAAGASEAASGARPTGSGRGFQFSLKSQFNPAGGVDLGTEQLPADTSDWTLVVGAGCTEVKVPLDAIEPARLPGIVVALVDAGNVAPVAGTYGLTVLRQIPLLSTGQNLVVYATAQNIFTVIAAMAADARVDGAQQEFVYQTTAEQSATGAGTSAATGGDLLLETEAAPLHYSDPYATLNYGPGMTGALRLHPAAAGKGQLIALIDTGIDINHPDLAGRLRTPVDTTDKGYAAEVHGTAVAGIIAAEADNAIGSYGVAPAAEILPIKACHPKEAGGLAARCTTSSLVKALDVAMTEDAAIINMSLAGPPDSLVARFVGLALKQDRLIVAGAGNGGEHAKPGFPAAIPGVLAVTAIDVANKLYSQANRGDYIDVSAPGVDIVSTALDGQYPPLSGTSMAAAHVTGVAALIRELGPFMGAKEIGLVIKSNTRDLGTPGADARFGSGLVDACRAASAATADAVACNRGEDDADTI